MRTTKLLGLILLVLGASGCQPSEAQPVGGDTAVVAAEDEGPRLRRVWSRSGDYSTPSPDGRLVTWVDWTTGDVAVYDVATGEERRITDKGTWTENGSWAEFPTFSPDGERVVYSYGNTQMGAPFRYELRWVELGDTTQHLLRHLEPGEYWIAPLDWSERGIVFVEYKDAETAKLGLLDPTTGAVETLEPSIGPNAYSIARASPDGRYVAYPMKDGMRVRDLDDGSVEILDTPRGVLLDWTADGRGLVFHAAADGRSGFWRVPIRSGAQAGPAELVRDGVPAVRWSGGRADNGFHYTVPVDAPRLYLGEVNLEAGQLVSAPVAVTTPMDGEARRPAWSPDGRQLAYLLTPLTGRGSARIMVRNAAGEDLRELATWSLGSVTSMVWSADGKDLLLTHREQGDLYAVSVRDGSVRKTMSKLGHRITVSADGRHVAAMRTISAPEARQVLAVAEVGSDDWRVLASFTGGRVGSLAFLDDHTLIYAVRQHGEGASEIRRVSLDGADTRVLARLQYPRHLEIGDWPSGVTPDGRYILANIGSSEEGSHRLAAVRTADGALQELNILGLNDSPTPYALSRDGARLAHVAGDTRSELWVMDRIDD